MLSKLFVLITLLIVSHTLSASMNEEEIKQVGKNAIMMMGKTLKENMIKHMKSGGPQEAANFCSFNATVLETHINEKYPEGVSVKRISAKVRNTANASTDTLEIEMLARIEKKHKNGETIPKMIVKKLSENHSKVFKPLFIGKACISCHGTQGTRNTQAYAIIKDKYPHDKATGYKAGDFRGFIVADILH